MQHGMNTWEAASIVSTSISLFFVIRGHPSHLVSF